MNLSLLLSSAILGVSIIIGCLIIQNHQGQNKYSSDHSLKSLMTLKETAEYLNLSEFQVRTIISSEENALNNNGSFTGKLFPMIRIGKDIYISTNGLNDWLNQATTQRTQY
ncbi:helix-turn-helix domain-containing protein [Cohnella pontilimi]|nr:helix-turn-helix domain-containing protein [Cohnella pontilimi]